MTKDLFTTIDPPKRIKPMPAGSPVYVSYGAGVDSTAMLIALRDHGIVPDLITFSDTGGEKPDTYEYINTMNNWCRENGFPEINIVRKKTTDRVEYNDLYGNCFDNETLPSLAFGMKSCSIKWKADAINYSIKGCSRGPNKCDPHPSWTAAVEAGIKAVTMIGYDSSPADLKRVSKFAHETDDFYYSFPLVDMGWKREDCVKRILEEGLPVPMKSACYFCPASKKWELWWLAGHHPDLLEKALLMEHKAMVGRHSRFDVAEFGDDWLSLVKGGKSFPSSNTTVGLGRSFAWNHWARVNKVIDDSGKVIIDPDYAKARAVADMGDGSGNAMDIRACA